MKKYIDLFAGVGGFHLAFSNKARCVFASEWDLNARKTYLENWGEEIINNKITFAEDINKVDYHLIPDFDILCAGFPCQPFSIAGKQLGFSHATQGTLFFNILEILKIKKPEVVFLENVKNLKSHDGGNTFNTILQSLKDLGYHVKYEVLNGLEYGNVPQNRERIFIVGFLNKDKCNKFKFPEKNILTKKIKDCLENYVNHKYYQTNMNSNAVKKMHEEIKNEYSIYQYRRYYLRENKSQICPTLTANMGTGGHNVPLIKDNKGIRKLTPRECFNFQGYPKDYKLPNISDSHLYKQAGNTVVVTLVERIAEEIINVIDK